MSPPTSAASSGFAVSACPSAIMFRIDIGWLSMTADPSADVTPIVATCSWLPEGALP